MLLEMLLGEPGCQPWHSVIHLHWVEMEWTIPSTSLVIPEEAQEYISVCVWTLRRPRHRVAIHNKSINSQNLKTVKLMKCYGNP